MFANRIASPTNIPRPSTLHDYQPDMKPMNPSNFVAPSSSLRFTKCAALAVVLAAGIASQADAAFTINVFTTWTVGQGNGLTLTGSNVNLQENAIIVQTPAAGGTNYATLYSNVARGANGGSWTGLATLTGGSIRSSTANANPQGITGLGIIDNNDFGYGTFLGVNPIGAGAALIMYTWLGDGDLNGVIDLDDLSVFSDAFAGFIPAKWANGDLDYNGFVDLDDASILSDAFSFQSGVLPAFSGGGGKVGSVSTVPEPNSIALLTISAVGLLGRRRRKSALLA